MAVTLRSEPTERLGYRRVNEGPELTAAGNGGFVPASCVIH